MLYGQDYQLATIEALKLRVADLEKEVSELKQRGSGVQQKDIDSYADMLNKLSKISQIINTPDSVTNGGI